MNINDLAGMSRNAVAGAYVSASASDKKIVAQYVAIKAGVKKHATLTPAKKRLKRWVNLHAHISAGEIDAVEATSQGAAALGAWKRAQEPAKAKSRKVVASKRGQALKTLTKAQLIAMLQAK